MVFLIGTEGKAAIREWSPNRLLLRIEARNEGTVVVNQNYDSGWRIRGNAEGERRVGKHEGLLAVAVSPADREVELYYRPTSFVVGAYLSSASLLALLVVAKRSRQGDSPAKGRDPESEETQPEPADAGATQSRRPELNE